MEGMLDLLGWRFAKEGGIYHDFEHEFKALGVDLPMSSDGLVVSNIPSRTEVRVYCVDVCVASHYAQME
eukprot:3369555-Amphidinium_carterae.1